MSRFTLFKNIHQNYHKVVTIDSIHGILIFIK